MKKKYADILLKCFWIQTFQTKKFSRILDRLKKDQPFFIMSQLFFNVIFFVLIRYRLAMPFGNKKKYFTGSFEFIIVTI